MTDQNNLPVTQQDNFVADFEKGNVDLSDLYDKQFIVGMNSGSRNRVGVVAATLHGPYDFAEMCESVGKMWAEDQHHAKVLIISRDKTQGVKALDEGTIDYIEAFHEDIVFEAAFEKHLVMEDKPIKAGIVEESIEDYKPKHEEEN